MVADPVGRLVPVVLVQEWDDEPDSELCRLSQDAVHLVEPAAVPLPVSPASVPAVDVAAPDVLALDLRFIAQDQQQTAEPTLLAVSSPSHRPPAEPRLLRPTPALTLSVYVRVTPLANPSTAPNVLNVSSTSNSPFASPSSSSGAHSDANRNLAGPSQRSPARATTGSVMGWAGGAAEVGGEDMLTLGGAGEGSAWVEVEPQAPMVRAERERG